MDAKDITLIGLAGDIAGAALLAHGFMVKGVLDIYDETGTRLGRNLAMVKSVMLQRSEAWGGAVLLLGGFALQILAALEVSAGPRRFVGWGWFVALLAFSAALLVVGSATCVWLGKRRFYEWALRNYEGKPSLPPKNAHEEQELYHYGRLYDVVRRKDEDVDVFLTRLNEVVATLGRRHRGKLSLPSDAETKSGT